MLSTCVITSRTQLTTLVLEWRSFLTLRTPYSGPGFALSWLDSHPEAKPHVVIVRDLAGRLVALAPWCLVTRPSGIRVLTGIGGDDTWYHDPVFLEPSKTDVVAAALVKGLRQGPSWDVARLTLNVDLVGQVRRAFRSLGWVADKTEAWRQSYLVEYQGTWEEFWSRRSASVRRKHRNIKNRLADHQVRWLQADERSWESMLDELFAMHERKLRHVRDWSTTYRCARAVAAEALYRGELGLFGLEIDGQVAALELTIRRDDRAFALMCAFDEKFSTFSAGALLHTHTLEHWCRAGLPAVDLGPGEFDWKLRFCTGQLPMTQLLIGNRLSLAGTSVVGWQSVIKPILRPMFRTLRSASF